MKFTWKALITCQTGQALVMALILLAIAGLMIAPLLAYMNTGLVTGGVYEKKEEELYAADAGVEDAVWRIQRDIGLCPGNPSTTYNISDINGKSVAVTITYVTNTTSNTTTTVTYQVESTATSGGSGTTVQAYVTATTVSANYSGIMDNVITSQCDYTLQGPTQVDPPEGEEHGPQANYPGDWPTAKVFHDMYWDDVKDYPYNSGTLDVKNYAAGIGPLGRNGTLQIINTGTAGLTVQLTGTVYVTGDTLIGTTNKAFTIDLNGQTIFVESATGAAPEDDPCNPSENQYALTIGTKCTLKGSGCIIAIGNIQFKPNLSCSPSDFIFALSVRGKTYMQPNGDFYGALAGKSEVYIQNGEAYWWESPFIQDGFNFPYMTVVNRLYNIASWEVSPA